MEPKYIEITNNEFEKIYSDVELLISIVFARKSYDSHSNFKYYTAVHYPNNYIVTPEQIDLAKQEFARAKESVYSLHENHLLFCSMGGSYAPRYQDDPCNHRIRTEFLNSKGKRYFIELGTYQDHTLHVDFSIDRDMEAKHDKEKSDISKQLDQLDRRSAEYALLRRKLSDMLYVSSFKNFGGLEHTNLNLKYTLQNILKLINETFNCNFKEIYVDHHIIHPSDREIICRSPRTATGMPSQLELFTTK